MSPDLTAVEWLHSTIWWIKPPAPPAPTNASAASFRKHASTPSTSPSTTNRTD